MHTTVYWHEMDSPIGTLVLARTEKGLCYLAFRKEQTIDELKQRFAKWFQSSFRLIASKDEVSPYIRQMEEYFQKERRIFDLPLDIHGTAFQKKVWDQLQRIPYGECFAYKQIAERIHQPRVVRAVGGAVNCNPISIVIPCHRVIGADGSLTGYGGGLGLKRYLLQHEGWRME